MAVTNFSPLLGLALPTTGDLSGTWGTTVNTAITSLIDSAVAGTTTLSADADVTLTSTNGSSNQAREAILLCTGARTTLKVITAPAQSKAYIVINATTGGFSVKVVGSGPTTGVTILNGEKALIAWNGSDFVIVATSVIDLTSEISGVLPVANGGTGVSASGASSNLLTSNGSIWVSTAPPAGGLVGITATQTLTNKTITALKETKVASSTNFDLSAANYFTYTVSAITTFTVSNTAASGSVSSFILDITNGGAYAITWFAGVQWPGGIAPVLTTSGRDSLGFYTYDGGTVWTGLVLGKAIA